MRREKKAPKEKRVPQGEQGPEGKQGLTTSELEALESIPPYSKFVSSGVGGRPTVQFSGVNLQLVNSQGKTTTVNGEGNLVIGYDENSTHKQTGSHNLILGEEQTFTSYGGIIDGKLNAIESPFASITAGEGNSASAEFASVSGGRMNSATGRWDSVSGGEHGLTVGPRGARRRAYPSSPARASNRSACSAPATGRSEEPSSPS